MPDVKRIMISMPAELLREIDAIVLKEEKNRSEFMREAVKMYISECWKQALREEMKKGYKEMAEINLSMAGEDCEAENEAQGDYEKRSAECKP